MQLAGALADVTFEAESGDLVEAVQRLLRERGLTVATAESCTGGLVAKRLTDLPGSSETFLGGVVAYSDPVKTALLGVDPALIRRHGAVSPAVAREMARGIAAQLGSDCAIGVTGIAGPGGGSEQKPVGTVCYAVWLDGTVEVRTERFPGNRESVRERSSQAALALLLRTVESAR